MAKKKTTTKKTSRPVSQRALLLKKLDGRVIRGLSDDEVWQLRKTLQGTVAELEEEIQEKTKTLQEQLSEFREGEEKVSHELSRRLGGNAAGEKGGKRRGRMTKAKKHELGVEVLSFLANEGTATKIRPIYTATQASNDGIAQNQLAMTVIGSLLRDGYISAVDRGVNKAYAITARGRSHLKQVA